MAVVAYLHFVGSSQLSIMLVQYNLLNGGYCLLTKTWHCMSVAVCATILLQNLDLGTEIKVKTELYSELLGKNGFLAGNTDYFQNLNEFSDLGLIMKNQKETGYLSALKALAKKNEDTFNEIYQDLNKNIGIMRYVPTNDRQNLHRFILRLYEVSNLTSGNSGKKNNCFSILTLSDTGTSLKSKSKDKEVEAAEKVVRNGKFLTSSSRLDVLKKAATHGMKSAAGSSGEKMAFLLSVGKGKGQEFFYDVWMKVSYTNSPRSVKGDCGKILCSKECIEYFEKKVFGKLIFASNNKEYAKHLLLCLDSVATKIKEDVTKGFETDDYIVDKNAKNLVGALSEIYKGGVSVKRGLSEKILKLTLYFTDGTLTLEEIKRRFQVPDVTEDLDNLMRSNAYRFVDNRGDLIWFMNQVKDQAEFDLKNSNPQYEGMKLCIYDGKLLRGDAPGNISYGYFGLAAGLSETLLLAGGGVYQIYDDVRSRADFSGLFRIFPDFGDNKGDQEFIKMGFERFWRDWYASEHPGTEYGHPVPGPAPLENRS